MDINDLTCSNTDGNLTKIEFDIKRTKALLKCVKDDVVRGILLDKLHDLEEQKKEMEPCSNKSNLKACDLDDDLCEESRPSIDDVEVSDPMDEIPNLVKAFVDDLNKVVRTTLAEHESKIVYDDRAIYDIAKFILVKNDILNLLDVISYDKESKYNAQANLILDKINNAKHYFL